MTRPLAFRDPPARRSPLRTRRRRTRTVVLLSLAVLLAIVAYGVSFASYLPRFSIQHIEVAGTNDIQPDQIRTFVDNKLESNSFAYLSPRNIFFYPRGAIEMGLREYFPRIESAKISRESLLANAISVSVHEREAFARWCPSTTLRAGAATECYAVDTTGFIFASATSTTRFTSSYIFEGSISEGSSPIGQTYLPGRFAGILTLLERLGQAGISAEKVSVEGEQDFSVELSRGFEIHATFGTDVGLLVKNLELILASEALRGKEGELEYIDLRFGNRVYYKLKGAAQQTAP